MNATEARALIRSARSSHWTALHTPRVPLAMLVHFLLIGEDSLDSWSVEVVNEDPA